MGESRLGGTSACLRDLPTPAEAAASRRREPLRRRQGRTFNRMSTHIPNTPSTSLWVAFSRSLKMPTQPPSEVPPRAGFIHGRLSTSGFTYLLLPSVPPDKPPILLKSTKGTAPPGFRSCYPCPNRCLHHLFTSKCFCTRPPRLDLFGAASWFWIMGTPMPSSL